MCGPVLYKTTDKTATLVFTFTGDFLDNGGLLQFDEITMEVGGESYSTTTTPESLFMEDESRLTISIGDITSLNYGSYHPKIIGFNDTYDDGYPLLVRGDGGSSKLERLRIEPI